ncbi:MAG TPA: hypothetical protein VIH89_06900 [Candidatus Sulfotelmatobacter sp.]
MGTSSDLGRALPGRQCSHFRVGGVTVEVSGERSDDIALVPSAEPFRVSAGASDIDIQVEWVERLGRESGRRLFDSGSIWKLYEGETGFQFDFSAPVFGERPYKRLFVDESFCGAVLHMSEESFAGSDDATGALGYPLDELLIMHRLTQEKAIELHGCGIVSADGTGNLFVGHSGAGKSTTTRLWTASEDVEILSDDRIIVRAAEPKTLVEAPFGSTGGAASAGVLRFAQDDRVGSKGQPSSGHMRMYGTPWHGEAMFASPASAPLTRIMVLEHGHGNVLTRLSSSQAVAELFARSFVPMHRHEYVESELEFLQSVAESVPCYRYSFEPDARAVEKILNLHD